MHAVEQKETNSHMCATFNKNTTLIQALQKQTDPELSARTKLATAIKISHQTYKEMGLQKGTLLEKRSIPEI